MRPIQHLYSDQLPEPGTVRCYSLDEVYAEKIRAMGERGRPRDLDDIVFLLGYPGLVDQSELISDALIAKCESKGVPVPTLELTGSPDPGSCVYCREWRSARNPGVNRRV